MRETTTLYRKVGKRYVKHDDYLDEKGLPEGLYLFYKKKDYNGMVNMLHYVKVHEIQNVDRFCDIYVEHHEKINAAVEIAIRKGGFSVSDVTKNIIAELSNIEL